MVSRQIARREDPTVSDNGNKTRESDASVSDFINAIEDEVKRNDAWKLVDIMTGITGKPPKMWGPSIVGFGTYHYKYESGREGDMPIAGFSPRKAAITLYLNSATGWDANDDLLDMLGKYKLGKGCLYVKWLADVDMEKLTALIERSAREFS
jgi:nucleoid DNA-binding protein